MTKRGMSLIELLVAMLITCMVGYIAFDLIRDENGNYTKTRNKVRLQADAREAIRVIEEDLANIGYHEGLILKPVTAAPHASPIYASVKHCDDSIPLHKRVEVSDNPNGSDTIVARFFRPDRELGVECGTTPYVVRYLIDNKNQLVRDLWLPGKHYPSSTDMNHSVILDSVSTLQVETDLDTITYSTSISVTGHNHPIANGEKAPIGGNGGPKWTLSGGISTATTLAQMTTAKDSGRVVSGWSTTTGSMLFLSPYKPLPRVNYRFSCLLSVDQAFTNLFNAASPLTGSGLLQMILYSSNTDTLAKVDLRLPEMVDGPSSITFTFQTTDLTTGVNSLHLNVLGRLVRDTTVVSPSITIGAINVDRVGGAPTISSTLKSSHWQFPVNDSATNTKIKGLRIWLVAKSQKSNREPNATNFSGIGNWIKNGTKPAGTNSYAIYERIIPVVKNGY